MKQEKDKRDIKEDCTLDDQEYGSKDSPEIKDTKDSHPKKENPELKDKKDKDKDLLIDDLTDTLRRLQADFENYKRRTEKEKENCIVYASESMIKDLLPFLDSFELALNNKENKEEFLKGVELIYSQLWELLENKGLKSIDCKDKPFDPNCHEALLSEKSDKPENTVIQELQKGYMLKDKIIRPSKVKVSKKC